MPNIGVWSTLISTGAPKDPHSALHSERAIVRTDRPHRCSQYARLVRLRPAAALAHTTHPAPLVPRSHSTDGPGAGPWTAPSAGMAPPATGGGLTACAPHAARPDSSARRFWPIAPPPATGGDARR